MPRARYYVVWVGREPGIYRDWAQCHAQVDGFSGARFRSFADAAQAERAWVEAGGDPMPFDDLELLEPSVPDQPRPKSRPKSPKSRPKSPKSQGREASPVPGSIAVDAACSGNPGPMEYRGVEIDTGAELFRVGPMRGTNNIGEFLAIVHGLAWLREHGRVGPLYTDSKIAMGWVRRGRARTTLARSARTESAWQLLDRAQRWLARAGPGDVEIRKWPTRRWGEIPADFGRK
ncbi:MAG: ribonuclease H family protein [Myxococcota bacterium]